MSFLSSLLNVFLNFTLSLTSNGMLVLPVTKLRTGSIFTDMQNAINYVDQAGKYFLGQPYGSNSAMSQPNFQQAPDYTPGETTPPKSWPTYQPTGYEVPLGVNEVSQYRFSAEALRQLKVFEGLHQRPYQINGQTYIGYGHKISSFEPATNYMSRDEADSTLASDISAAEGLVKGAISTKITQGMFDALVDFAYTTTASKFKGSTVVQKINSGDIPGAATDLAQWVYINQGGTVSKSPHLSARRSFNVFWMTMPADVQPPT